MLDASGRPVPPTAQAADDAGAYVGRVIADLLDGRPPAPFRWRPKGHLVLLGYRGAVAQVGPLIYSGVPAWLSWHAFYLTRVPSWRHRVRLVVDWILAGLLGRDSSQIRL